MDTQKQRTSVNGAEKKKETFHVAVAEDEAEMPVHQEDLEDAKALEQDESPKLTITARCRSRLMWAKSVDGQGMDGSGREEDGKWVCSTETCGNPVCTAYRVVCKAYRVVDQTAGVVQSAQAAVRSQQQRTEEIESSNGTIPESSNGTILVLMKELLAGKKELLARDKELLADKKELLYFECERIHHAHRLIKEALMQGANTGNKTSYVTNRTNRDELNKEAQSLDKLNPSVNDDPNSPSVLLQVLDDTTTMEVESSHLDDSGDLIQFYIFCETLFKNGVKVPENVDYESNEFETCIKKTVKCITDWTKSSLVPNEIYIPSHTAQETKAVQPILFAVMWKISMILDGTMHLTREQFLPQHGEKSKRWMDGMRSNHPQHYLKATMGSLLGKSVEIKPLQRASETFLTLVNAGGNQVLGHNSQIILDSYFNFCGGLGRDGESDGIVLTMASAQAHFMSLKNVGTAQAKLATKQTPNMPLFSEETTMNLFGNDSDSLETSGLIFEKPNAEGQVVIQKGFKQLVSFVMDGKNTHEKLATSSDGCLTNLSNSRTIDYDVTLGDYLGSGAFSTVFAAVLSEGVQPDADMNQDGLVVPNPSMQRPTILKFVKDTKESLVHLEGELLVLQCLQGNNHIPALCHDAILDFQVQQRCEWNSLKCLALDMPRGTSAREAVRNLETGDRKNLAKAIFWQVDGALKYAHGKKTFHLDVNPSNIIVVPQPQLPEKVQVILVDWGAAQILNGKRTSRVKGFRGTPPFAPRELLNMEKEISWTPTNKHDNYSLVLTFASLLCGGNVPWPGFHRPNKVKKNLIEERDQLVKTIFQQHTLSNDDSMAEILEEYQSGNRRPRKAHDVSTQQDETQTNAKRAKKQRT